MDPLDRFAEIVSEEDFPLADAFLAFARAEYPELDTDAYLEQIQDLGLAAAAGAQQTDDPRGKLMALAEALSAFTGNVDSYYDPRNSFLNEVVERRLGIPISLSVLWLEAGRWAGVDLYGAAMPMHFLVGLSGEDLYADPFDGGNILTADEAMLRFGRLTEGRIAWQDSYLDPARPRQVVRRALLNLKTVFIEAGDLHRALWVEDYLLALPDTPPDEHRARASLLAALGRWPDAISDLRDYLIEDEEADRAAVELEIIRFQAAMN